MTTDSHTPPIGHHCAKRLANGVKLQRNFPVERECRAKGCIHTPTRVFAFLVVDEDGEDLHVSSLCDTCSNKWIALMKDPSEHHCSCEVDRA